GKPIIGLRQLTGNAKCTNWLVFRSNIERKHDYRIDAFSTNRAPSLPPVQAVPICRKRSALLSGHLRNPRDITISRIGYPLMSIADLSVRPPSRPLAARPARPPLAR
ncbi:hypothetical protein, partial [Pseudomonas aeruginosa]|uniref:hypothetical protein n=1 Tax=Pseudomonas aeruginosa TaxID=287 RepID=UPI0039696144